MRLQWACILAEGNKKVPNTGTVPSSNNRNKEVVFKNCALFADSICNSKDIIDVVMNRYIEI